MKEFRTLLASAARGAIFGALALAASGALAAYVGPPGAATTCPTGYSGCDAPLNTSATAQTKSGTIISNTDIRAPLFYDLNNLNYYLDLNGNSRLNYGIFDQIYSYGWIQAAGAVYGNIFYDVGNSNYYVQPRATSILNSVEANIYYDLANTNYYVDPASVSNVNYLYRNYGYNGHEYDANNTTYYVDPNSTSNFSTVAVQGNLCLNGVCKSAWPGAGHGFGGMYSVTGTNACLHSNPFSVSGGCNCPSGFNIATAADNLDEYSNNNQYTVIGYCYN